MSIPPDEQRTCAAVTKEGASCRMRPLANDTHCWNHSTLVAAERAAARKQGGRNRRTAAGRPLLETSIRSVEAIQGQLEAVLGATWQQENSNRRSLALASLLGLALKVQEQPRHDDPVWRLNERVVRGQGQS